MKQDEKRELCAACFIYAYQTAEMREAPLCAQCPTALTTRNREDCEAYYGDVGWFETYGEPEGYFCAQCLSNLCCDQLQGRSRDYDFSQMERIWVEYDMWQAYLTGSDQSEGLFIQGGGSRPTPSLVAAKVEEAVIQFGEGGTLEEEAAAAAAEAAMCDECDSEPVEHICSGCSSGFCGKDHGGCWMFQRTQAEESIENWKQDEKRELCFGCFESAYEAAQEELEAAQEELEAAQEAA
jgi:hypothetical protein